MGLVRIDQAISLDGYTAGPEQSMDHPLGVGGHGIMQYQFKAGVGGPASNLEPMPSDVTPDQQIVYEHFQNVGAYIMGRNMFGGGPGAWATDPVWEGWWGSNPPYHTPVYVLTHHPREPLALEGGTTFHFVTDGPEAALALAREAAGDRDVKIAGGASTVAQYLRLGVVDVLQLHIAPVLLGGGERPFDGVDPATLGFEIDRVLQGLSTHVRYRVSRS
ncbi:MAG: dihydrofolate reductase family protein [Patulibacter minatonensis]